MSRRLPRWRRGLLRSANWERAPVGKSASHSWQTALKARREVTWLGARAIAPTISRRPSPPARAHSSWWQRKALQRCWAQIQHRLGGVYLSRLRGDRAENLERAIAAYEAALTVRTRSLPGGLGEDAEQSRDRLSAPHPRRAGGQPRAGDRALRGGAHRLYARGLPRGLGDNAEQSRHRLPEPHPRRAGGQPRAGDRALRSGARRSIRARPSRRTGR